MISLFDDTEHMENLEEIYNKMEANCPNPRSTSKKLWKLRHACDITSHNPYPETKLEYAVANLAENGYMPEWFNQCPVASGITDASVSRQASKAVNKRSAVDLVHWDKANEYARLVELKWESSNPPKWKSNNPLDALSQILRYGAAYLFCLVHRGQLNFPAESLIKMNARHVSLEVVAPQSCCQDLIARINKPHGEFIDNGFVDSKVSRLSMSLNVLAFPDGFQAEFEQRFKNGEEVKDKCDTPHLTAEGQAVREAFNNLVQVWP